MLTACSRARRSCAARCPIQGPSLPDSTGGTGGPACRRPHLPAAAARPCGRGATALGATAGGEEAATTGRRAGGGEGRRRVTRLQDQLVRGGNELVDRGLSSGLLVLCTIVSLALANLPYTQGAWLALWDYPVPLAIGGHVLSVRGWINEGLMCFFFFGVGLEIKKEVIAGSLSSVRTASLPCIAAVGGMLVPMAVYFLVNRSFGAAGSMAALTVPMATDIAFAVGIYGFFKDRMPPSALTFLLTLATVDDLGAILVIATLFASNVVAPYLAAAVAATGALAVLERFGVQSGKPYLAVGVVLWVCLLLGGVTADIAGVLTAMALPAHTATRIAASSRPVSLRARITQWLTILRTPSMARVEELVRVWAPINALLVMPLFALANTAIPLAAQSGAMGLPPAAMPISLGIFLGLLLGKPVGILFCSLLAIRLGICRSLSLSLSLSLFLSLSLSPKP